MEKETLFSNIPNDILFKYKEIGYYYDDCNYINIFRWLWNEKHVHPVIKCFPNDPLNRVTVRIHNYINGIDDVFYGNNYDDGIIYVVEQFIKNPKSYIC